MPHGVLFRSQKEGDIRRALLERGQLRGVIGLPDKLFLNTGVPVCIIEAVKDCDPDTGVMFIDASRDYVKGSKQNNLSPEQASRILATYSDRVDVDKYAHLATPDEIRDNGFNLNIHRYVDTFESEPLPDLAALFHDLAGLNNDIHSTETVLAGMAGSLQGYSMDELEGLDAWRRSINSKRGTLRTCSTSNAPKTARRIQPALF